MEKPEYAILVQYFKKELSTTEIDQVEQWVSASESNKKEFEQLKSVWAHHGEKADEFSPNLKLAWEKIEAKVDSSYSSGFNWWYRIAAVLVVGIGIALFVFNNSDTQTLSEVRELAPAEFIAEAGVQEIALPDGTIITLDRGASISYDSSFGDTERKVQLSGKAFFEVSHDKSRPFIIESGGTTTTVLGTSFMVDPDQDVVTVTVVTGRVSFEGELAEEVVLLTKGEQGNYDRRVGKVSESDNGDRNFLSWKTGKLTFENTSFETVQRDLQRHFDIIMETQNTQIQKLTASFDNQSKEEVMEIIAATLDITIEERTANHYIIH